MFGENKEIQCRLPLFFFFSLNLLIAGRDLLKTHEVVKEFRKWNTLICTQEGSHSDISFLKVKDQ